MKRPSCIWQIWQAGRSHPEALRRIQLQRVINLVAFARSHSPFFAHYYREVPKHYTDLRGLPPVTKAMLMANFDEWVTDTAVSRAGIEKFVADPALVGRPYLDRYFVYTTSGTTGTPGIFLHDNDALAVYDLLWLVRGWLPWLGPWRLLHSIWSNFCEVFVVATGAHFAGVANAERLRQRYPWVAGRLHNLSVMLPLADLIRQLNRLSPKVLAIYPTALSLLTQAQLDGRLAIQPLFIITSGEWLAPAVRQTAAKAFNCPVRNVYACSEFIYMAFACGEGWLHINADWLILEPVDSHYDPVMPGKPSHTVLLTNLANRVQPLIRYDLGDSVTVKSDPCPCGSPFPAMKVEGRQDEILSFATADGSIIQIAPGALVSVVETTQGVQRYQLIQTGSSALTVRLAVRPGADESQVWKAVASNLRRFLASQGLPGVVIMQSADSPRRDAHSGKFRKIWSGISNTLNKSTDIS